jgi:acyl-coenzyme A synthetase/AMP-(fatty) acid ligase
VKELPRNQMGKVVKPDVRDLFTGEGKDPAKSSGSALGIDKRNRGR